MLLPVAAHAADRQKTLIGWTYADGTELMFFARLKPAQPSTFIDETWSLESADTGYIAAPVGYTVRCKRVPKP